MKEILLVKLKSLSDKYRSGSSYGDVFEMTYLTYLECLLLSQGRSEEPLWTAWKDRAGELGQGPINRNVDSRSQLITEMEALRHKFTSLPTRREIKIPTSPLHPIEELFGEANPT